MTTAVLRRLQALDTVLCDYLSRKEIESGQSLHVAADMLDRWLTLRRQLNEANAQTGEAFNPLELIPLKETTHSRILGELLNPLGSHGQGALFLGCFLRHLNVPDSEQGQWRITVEEGRVDIMLVRERPWSVILIENKSNDAEDRRNQLYRYWHQQVYLVDPGLNYQDAEVCRSFRIIYLPTDESKMPAPHSLQRPAGWEAINPAPVVPLPCETIAFCGLVALLQREARPYIAATNARLLAFLDFYHDFWRSR